MMRNQVTCAWLVCLAALAASMGQACAQNGDAPPQPSAEKGLRLNFRGVPLDTVLDYLSRAAGFVIVREAELSGDVDVWSHQPLDKEEAVDLLNTVLNEKGFAAVRNGRQLTIVTREEARQRDIPVRKGSDPESIPRNDEMVTQIIPVLHTDAKQLVENITPLLPEYAAAAANEGSNAVILTDTQSNIRRMAEIIQALDTAVSEASTLKVYRLKHADATETANVINEIFQTEESRNQSGRGRRIAEFFSRMRGGPRPD